MSLEQPHAAAGSTPQRCVLYEPVKARAPSSAPASTGPAAALPDFEDIVILAAVALFHGFVCLGFRVAAAVASALVTIAMGLCAIARQFQAQHHATSITNTNEPKKGRFFLTNEATTGAVVKPTTKRPRPQATPVDMTMAPLPKPSPALPGTTTCDAVATCLLLFSSHNTGATQRSAIDYARTTLCDLLVVFEELDAALCAPDILQRLMRVRGACRGVYPQLFLVRKGLVELLSMEQLEAANHLAGVSLSELVRLDAVHESGLFLFQGVATCLLPTHTLDTQLRALGGIAVMRDSLRGLYRPWRVAVDMCWTQYMFEDAWDFYTTVKLYSLMP